MHDEPSGIVLRKYFINELEPILVGYLQSDNTARRVNAWYMLKAAGKTQHLKPDEFHAKTLRNFDARYAPTYFKDAVAYFKHRGKRKPGLARKALLDGVVHLRQQLKEYNYATGWKKTIEYNLKLVQGTLRQVQR
jgi:hypothetical protein